MRKVLHLLIAALCVGLSWFVSTGTAEPAKEAPGNSSPPPIEGFGPATSLQQEALKELPPGDTGLGPTTSVPPITPPPPVGPTTGLGPEVSTEPELPKAARPPRNIIDQTRDQAMSKSVGCMECHKTTDSISMHTSPNVVLGCVDCHGGNAKKGLSMEQAHVLPRNPEFWKSSANPANATTVLNHESPEFIRFINPGDLRVADQACGTCHGDIVNRVGHSMMNHGAMLWNAAAYNNGAIDKKNAIVGQAYGQDGIALRLNNPFTPTAEETKRYGWLPALVPLPRFNRSQPGNVLRIFEKGGFEPLQLGLPTLDEPPGKPDRRLSPRGLGTLNRTDPVILGAQKTRLHDPLLGFMGSNDRPGDYRSSGCSACHVVYANDRSPHNSGWWAKYGNQGLSFSSDPTIPKNERGHPVKHEFTRAIPSSQCMNCHMHQGNLFVNPFLGYIWWDQETEAHHMYPKEQKDPDDDELVRATRQNPEAAAARGLWGNVDFLEKVAELNPKLKGTQFADYHGHGWVFRAVFKKDKKGNMLDLDDNIVAHGDFKKAIHLKDIHLERGMQCVDCHFEVEVHGNGLLYGEPRNATTIMCIDCHGTAEQRPTLITSGASGYFAHGGQHAKSPYAAKEATPAKERRTVPVDLAKLSTPWRPRFEWEDILDETGKPKLDARGQPIRKLYQNSTMSPNLRWEVPQTVDTIDPAHPSYNAKARYAKTLQRDGETWGVIPESPEQCEKKLAHSNKAMDCQICHSSWATSCFGCHMPMKANQRVPQNKYEGVVDRNFTTYNPQVVRDDVFQLGIDGTVKKHRMAVLRSSSAVLVGSQNANREWFYSQVQTVSGDGYSGQAYNPHFPHTTSGKGTTKGCTDCHVSKANDNNAWMASLLGFGTGTVNFFGRYAWAGGKGELNGIVWTEAEEPQAAIGSSFHKVAYPRFYGEHVARGRELKVAYHHHATEINDLTLRGEYLYTANGSAGLEVFDVANVDQKGFSERIVSAPVSPLGQRTYVRTKFATSVAMPSTLINDPLRIQDPENEEQPIHPFFGYVFVTDLKEGLVVVNVATLLDGDPTNNFLRRAKIRDGKGGEIDDAFNPDGRLTGATFGICAGHRVYICTSRGLAVVDVNRPEQPRLVGELADGFLKNPKSVYIQFNYAFVTDDDGLKVIDISNPEHPRSIKGAVVRLNNAQKLYVARTYAYVANGPEGIAIIDVENPERPRLDQMFSAGGQLNDTRAIQIGSVNASMYGLVADGKNGFRVVQMISPDTVPTSAGFSPRPSPRLIATYHTHKPVLAVSRGLDRDRVVDETGNQTVVFGRRGSRPFHIEEMRPFLKHANGTPYRVEDIVTRTVEEEIEINGQKQKVPRTGVFTKSGKELLPVDHGVPKTLQPLRVPLVPNFIFDINQALPPIQPPLPEGSSPKPEPSMPPPAEPAPAPESTTEAMLRRDRQNR